MFERLLLAVDGSEASRRAGEVAIQLARLSGGEVIVCHVTEAEPELTRASRRNAGRASLSSTRAL